MNVHRGDHLTHIWWRLYLRTPRVSATGGFMAGLVVGVALALAVLS